MEQTLISSKCYLVKALSMIGKKRTRKTIIPFEYISVAEMMDGFIITKDEHKPLVALGSDKDSSKKRPFLCARKIYQVGQSPNSGLFISLHAAYKRAFDRALFANGKRYAGYH